MYTKVLTLAWRTKLPEKRSGMNVQEQITCIRHVSSTNFASVVVFLLWFIMRIRNFLRFLATG